MEPSGTAPATEPEAAAHCPGNSRLRRPWGPGGVGGGAQPEQAGPEGTQGGAPPLGLGAGVSHVWEEVT